MTGPRPTLLLARGVLPRASAFVSGPSELHGGAGLLVSGGRVLELARGAGAVRRLQARSGGRVRDLGDVLLLPGLVNAHAHLELGSLLGRLPGDGGFPAWVGGILRARAGLEQADYVAAARDGLARAMATGTTTLGDVDSTGAVLEALTPGTARPRLRVYREVLDAWDPERTAAALAGIARRLGEGALLSEGYSPHAPFTTSRALLAGVRRQQRKRPRPLAVHWSESPEELDWLESGTGGFAPFLGPGPGTPGLDLLEQAGLLGPDLALVHGNLPRPGELDRIAAAGASVVHCPGTHRFFDRAPFPLDAYRRAGVPLALGTDSLASNQDLDLCREGRLLLEARPELDPLEVLELATTGGARALGLVGEVGALETGHRADALVLPAGAGCSPRDLAEGMFLGHQPFAVLQGGKLRASAPGKSCLGAPPRVS